MKVFEGLYFYPGITGLKVSRGAGTSNTVIIGHDQLILIDPGESVGRCITTLEKRTRIDGKSLENVQLMMFTHVHFDHANAASIVQRRSNCTIRTHPHDVESIENPVTEYERTVLPIMESKEFPSVPLSVARFFLDVFIGKRLPARIDSILHDGEIITHEGLTIEVIFTPGHSPGHIAYYIKEYKVMVAGDTIDRELDGVIEAGAAVNNMESSWEDIVRSMEILSRYDIDVYIPGHGEIIRGKAAVQAFISRNVTISLEKPSKVFASVLAKGSMLNDIFKQMYPVLPFSLHQVKKVELFIILQYLVKGNFLEATSRRKKSRWRPVERSNAT